MFFLGLVAALLLILLLGLTMLRTLDHRPNPNAALLCDLMASLQQDRHDSEIPHHISPVETERA